jgi:hypothetical protein
VDNKYPSIELTVAGRFGNPIVLSVIVGDTKEAFPLVNEVRTKPVENGALFEISYAKILRKTIESVSYVRLELELIYFVK